MRRRDFSILLSGGLAAASASAARFTAKVGLELYSLRREIAKDLPGTLALIRKMGFEEVEVPQFYGLEPGAFQKLLKAHGLTATALVTNWKELSEGVEAVAGKADAIEARYLLVPGIPRKGAFTADDARRAAENFGKWGEALRQRGKLLCYHLHGFEFGPSAEGTLADTLIQLCPAKSVAFELDTFWVARGGGDPVAMLKKYPGRFPLVHLKDMARGTPVNDLSGSAPDEVSVALGAGVLDIRGFLAAAPAAGVKHYYIEDESPLAMEQIPRSLKFLEGLR